MPAAAGTAFNWVRVSSGIWTRIWTGPLVSGLPFQGLALASTTPTSGRTIMFTLDGYSAAPPFYERTVNTATGVFFYGAPPLGHTAFYAAVLSFRISPWVEFNILTDTPCFAHIALL